MKRHLWVNVAVQFTARGNNECIDHGAQFKKDLIQFFNFPNVFVINPANNDQLTDV